MTVTIRPYRDQDAAATAEVFLRAIREVAVRDYSSAQIAAWGQVEDLEAWGKRRAAATTWIAMHDNAIAGFSDLLDNGRLDMMFVHPDHQGVGVASSLLAQVERQAHLRNFSAITTEASRTARGFFEVKGFVLIRAQQVERRGEVLENFLMEKVLPFSS
jgi:putative acetyltransferase